MSNLITEDLILQPPPGTRCSTSHVILTRPHIPLEHSAVCPQCFRGFCTPFPGKEDGGVPDGIFVFVLRVRTVDTPLGNAYWLLFLTPSGQGQTSPTGLWLSAAALHILMFIILQNWSCPKGFIVLSSITELSMFYYWHLGGCGGR